MPFAEDIRRWATPADLAAHLARHDPAIAPWARGLCWHHTLIPRLNQWRGRASVEGARNFYIGKGWTSGPHLFLAAGSTNPAHDGIWQLTSIDTPGTHAGRCNASHIGIEIVGDYDRQPWSYATAELVYGVSTALLNWRDLGVSPQTVKGHKECLKNKSCPGTAINLDAARAELAARMTLAALVPPPPLTADSPIIAPPSCTQAQAARYILARSHRHYTSADIQLTILPAYWETCERGGVNPHIAVAQMIHETANLSSDWCARPYRNPVGIGVTGAFGAGATFVSWAGHAIPAHIGRLLAYALPPGERTTNQYDLIEQALAVRPLSVACQGSAPTPRLLGTGPNPVKGCGWAGKDDTEGLVYGEKIAAIANAMTRIPL